MTKKEFRKRRTLNGGIDRVIDGWCLIDIHEIPYPVKEKHEVDFYFCKDKKAGILRIRKTKDNEVERYSKVIDSRTDMLYLIAEVKIKKINNKLLAEILKEFRI